MSWMNRSDVEDLVARKPVLLHDFGQVIDERRTHLRRTLATSD